MSGSDRLQIVSESTSTRDGLTRGDTCWIIELVTLSSPVRAVVSRLKRGDRLSVEVQRAGRVDALVALTAERQLAGSLMPKSRTKLLDCIEKGRKYIALVTERNGGACTVEIRPVEA